MSEPKYVPVKHMGHDGAWLLPKTREEVQKRIAYIKENKPAAEIPIRLKLLGIVKDPLPPRWQKAYKARQKADAALLKSDETWEKAEETWKKANEVWRESNKAWRKGSAAWEKAGVAWHKAYAAYKKAEAVWQEAITSKAGMAFHEKVCGCGWSPEQPNILMSAAQEARAGAGVE